jgi:hypothetical protein
MSNMKPLMIVAEFSLPLGVLVVTVTANVTVTVTGHQPLSQVPLKSGPVVW